MSEQPGGNPPPSPQISITASTEQATAYRLGVGIGLLSRSADPMHMTWFYTVGSIGQTYHFAGAQFESPARFSLPMQQGQRAKASYYMGKGMTESFESSMDSVEASADWFRWGVQVGQRQDVTPFQLYDSEGNIFSQPHAMADVIINTPLKPAQKQAYMFGYTLGAGEWSTPRDEILRAFGDGFIDVHSQPPGGVGPLGRTPVPVILAYFLGRAQRKTYRSQPCVRWFVWGLQAGDVYTISFDVAYRYTLPFSVMQSLNYPLLSDLESPSETGASDI